MNDQGNRTNFTEGQRRDLERRFRSSGLTQREFAKESGLKLTTLQSWLYGKGGSLRRRQIPATGFQELKIAPAASTASWAAEIALREGLTVRVNAMAHPQWIGSVIEHLRKVC